MYVIGTAGHVDHGKSTLIKALTGIDPDRLREEKERQMTIDLGFAWLKLPSGEEIGIVDVPGHRDFIDNMLAGAGGIDAVLFIIAADEGIMPQTREHLAILKLLDIRSGIVVITKADLVDDEEWFDLIQKDFRQLAENSFLAEAPIVTVSAVSGMGLPELVNSIEGMIQKCPPKKDIGRARLPIDRVFSIKGFGTVVTGTMLDGAFKIGQQVELLPSKKIARIRGLQSHRKKLEETEPGSRTAVNLTGLDLSEIKRGDVMAVPGVYFPSRLVDVRFSMIDDASRYLSHNEEVKIYSGTAQSMARVRIIKRQKICPGEGGWLQIEMKNEMVVAKGDHFIIRKPSPAETIGGGVVLDPHPRGRHKRFSDAVYKHFAVMESGSIKERLINLIQQMQPVTIKEIMANYETDQNQAMAELKGMIGDEMIVINKLTNELTPNTLVSSRSAWDERTKELLNAVKNFHEQYPLREGISKNELRKTLGWDLGEFNNYVEGMVIRGLIRQKNGLMALSDYQVELSAEVKERIEDVLKDYQLNPFSPPSLQAMKEKYDADLIDFMTANNMLIVTSDDIAFRREDYDEMRFQMINFISRQGSITLGQFRDLIGTSRKYASSFLEHMDERGITSFDGEHRVIKSKSLLKK